MEQSENDFNVFLNEGPVKELREVQR